MQNPQKKLALYIILNKEKFTKIEIQKAQQIIDVDAVATNFNRN
jgi:hypothetical protein|tara:strand:+ start:879 stop:1010 length:132 start_codon:yes stop_codon:yes gene_type:complete